MHPSGKSLSRLLYLVFAILLLGAGEAQARRRGGIMIISNGTAVSELGKIQPEKLAALRLEGGVGVDKVGWRYEHFGIFWLDLWNWGGEYCIYADEAHPYRVDKATAAALMGVPENKLGKPFNYRMPYGLLVLIGLVSLKVVPRILLKRRQAKSISEYNPDRPAWTPPQNPPRGVPGSPPHMSSPPPLGAPPAGGPPPIPPPLPPE